MSRKLFDVFVPWFSFGIFCGSVLGLSANSEIGKALAIGIAGVVAGAAVVTAKKRLSASELEVKAEIELKGPSALWLLPWSLGALLALPFAVMARTHAVLEPSQRSEVGLVADFCSEAKRELNVDFSDREIKTLLLARKSSQRPLHLQSVLMGVEGELSLARYSPTQLKFDLERMKFEWAKHESLKRALGMLNSLTTVDKEVRDKVLSSFWEYAANE
ncbi:MAG: hypothetical protein H6807_11235 [Planctomycetes bacterium]|nr:hypothetical protein [Planctomycetota bacterium]